MLYVKIFGTELNMITYSVTQKLYSLRFAVRIHIKDAPPKIYSNSTAEPMKNSGVCKPRTARTFFLAVSAEAFALSVLNSKTEMPAYIKQTLGFGFLKHTSLLYRTVKIGDNLLITIIYHLGIGITYRSIRVAKMTRTHLFVKVFAKACKVIELFENRTNTFGINILKANLLQEILDRHYLNLLEICHDLPLCKTTIPPEVIDNFGYMLLVIRLMILAPLGNIFTSIHVTTLYIKAAVKNSFELRLKSFDKIFDGPALIDMSIGIFNYHFHTTPPIL